jgi:hydroxyacylglutathione hydrolase
MKLTSYTGGFVQTNGYLIESPNGNLVVDAPAGIADWLASRGVRIDFLLLTHQHYDHVEDAAALRASGAKLYAFADYSQDLTLESHARARGLPISVAPYSVDTKFDLSASLMLCGFTFQLAHVPGHSTDSVTLYLPENGIVFSGDTLFASGIGRTDLPHGSHRQLLDGISTQLLTLPGDTTVYSGHGPPTTVAAERAMFRH